MFARRFRNLPLFTLAAIGVWLSSAHSSAASTRDGGAPGFDPQRAPRELRVERSARLKPLPDAEVVLPKLEAIFLSDGSVTLRGKGTARAGAPPSGFDFTVDLAQETYTTHRLKPEEIEDHTPLQESSGINRITEGEVPGHVQTKISPGTWQGKVRVQTKDPAFIVLTETTVQVTWKVVASGTVTWLSYSDGCWAANPSALGTHWYNSSCSLGAAYYNSNRACNSNTGSYYNYDFLDASQGTFATDSDWLCGRNDATFDYNWSHNDSGEASLLIYGSVVLN